MDLTGEMQGKNGKPKLLDQAFSAFFVQLPNKLQNHLKSQFKGLAKDNDGFESANSFLEKEKGSFAGLRIDLEKQLQAWRENPSWVNQPPEIKVSVPKGSLCNLKAKLDVGLPPDAVYDILTDPDSKRIFKNIKEVISRKVLVDEGQRQVVEVEQAALWRFLWWSGTISVRVLVDQNREDHSMKFEQVNTGFMKKFKVAEADRLPGGRRSDSETSSKKFRLSKELNEYDPIEQIFNIKQRWSLHRRNAKQHRKKLLNV
ncbi:hypothetical protein ERO13_A01G161600v2 [Gossypium hirsutum]|nr:hypothetical protein ERO13_A01G161600v2 [Gossypium hirsutum]